MVTKMTTWRYGIIIIIVITTKIVAVVMETILRNNTIKYNNKPRCNR